MKKQIILLLISVLIFMSVIFPVTVFAEGETAPPAVGEEIPPETEPLPVPLLTKIEFNGASFPTEFQQNVFEYTINISSHEEFSLKSYSCTDYNAEMKIDYISNANGSTKGIIVTVKNASGANDYKFYFDTVQTMPKTSDTSLIGINFNYGELYPNFRSDVFKYTLYLPSDLEVLVVDPITSDENATINTPSQISLKKDQNTPISIKVTSSDGTSTGSYKLTIKRVDKTIADIQQMMEAPDFKSFVEIPFYKHATFYIITAGAIFAIMLIAVIVLSLKKSKKEPPKSDLQIILPAGSAIVPPTMLSTNDLPENSISQNNLATSTQDDTESETTHTDEPAELPVSKKDSKKQQKEAKRLAKIEAEQKAKAESEAREAEKKAKIEAEEKARLEAEIKAKAEAEAREKLEAEIREKAEAEAREKLESELREKAEAEAKAKEEEKAKILADVDEKAPVNGEWLGLDKYDQYK